MNYPTILGTGISKNSSERMHVKSLYLFRKLNNSCCNWAVQRQVLKCTRRSSVTSVIKSMIKCHKDLKGTDLFSRRCFRKKLNWKCFTKLAQKRLWLATLLRKTPSQLLYFGWQDFQSIYSVKQLWKAACKGIKSHTYNSNMEKCFCLIIYNFICLLINIFYLSTNKNLTNLLFWGSKSDLFIWKSL